MTVAATVLGLLPMALALGGSQWRHRVGNHGMAGQGGSAAARSSARRVQSAVKAERPEYSARSASSHSRAQFRAPAGRGFVPGTAA
jgi:hypothetical protein